MPEESCDYQFTDKGSVYICRQAAYHDGDHSPDTKKE